MELEDKQRGHRDRIESLRRLAEEEKTTIYIPEHGCDLLVGLSSVPDYSSALHDNQGSWYKVLSASIIYSYACHNVTFSNKNGAYRDSNSELFLSSQILCRLVYWAQHEVSIPRGSGCGQSAWLALDKREFETGKTQIIFYYYVQWRRV